MPRIATDGPEDKLVNYSSSDLLDEHAVGELMMAVKSKDVKTFLSALEALVLNCFEEDKDAIKAN